MNYFHKFLVLVAIIIGLLEESTNFKKNLEVSSHPGWKWFLVIDFMAKILAHIIIAYYFPALFIVFLTLKLPIIQDTLKEYEQCKNTHVSEYVYDSESE